MITKKLKHLCCAILNSYLSILICLFMLVFSMLFIAKTEQSSYIVSIISGIVTSTIATVLFRVTDKYINSLNTTIVLKRLITTFCNDFTTIKAEYNKTKLHKLKYLCVDISALSNNLTYKEDCRKLLIILDEMAEDIDNSSTKICDLEELGESLL